MDDYPDGHLVTYPGELSDCDTCHLEGTYMPEEVPVDALVTTDVTTDGLNASVEDVETARVDMPNDTDWVMSPTVGACAGCHNSDAAVAHMEQNGGAYQWTRLEYNTELPFESCIVCHDDGSSADVNEVHGL